MAQARTLETPLAEAGYRARDLLLAPSLLSLSRVPLAAIFACVVGIPSAALAVLLLAGISDVLDGWVARRRGLATATGAALDGITDKLFALVVAIALYSTGQLGVGALLLLSAREIGEATLLLWFLVSPSARARRAAYPRANVVGKLATVLQLMAIGLALFRAPGVAYLTSATAVVGALAALSYWRRELTPIPARRRDPSSTKGAV
jgi:phosphatidylglycerophosphate synthase